MRKAQRGMDAHSVISATALEQRPGCGLQLHDMSLNHLQRNHFLCQSAIHNPVTLAQLGIWLEIQTLRPHPHNCRVNISIITSSLCDSYSHYSLRRPALFQISA